MGWIRFNWMAVLKNIPVVLVLVLMLVGPKAMAASITLEVDPLGQEYDSIRIHMANLPRDFVWSDPPVYAGTETVVTIPGLVPGQTYKFAAVLTREDQVSPGSNIVERKMPVVVIELQPPKLWPVEIRNE